MTDENFSILRKQVNRIKPMTTLTMSKMKVLENSLQRATMEKVFGKHFTKEIDRVI